MYEAHGTNQNSVQTGRIQQTPIQPGPGGGSTHTCEVGLTEISAVVNGARAMLKRTRSDPSLRTPL